jgi:hypothetical protein
VVAYDKIGLKEARHIVYEREARASAAGPLMPLAEVSLRLFALVREHPVAAELRTENRVRRRAEEFAVAPSAMGVRLEQMRLVLSSARQIRPRFQQRHLKPR